MLSFNFLMLDKSNSLRKHHMIVCYITRLNNENSKASKNRTLEGHIFWVFSSISSLKLKLKSSHVCKDIIKSQIL